MQGRCCILNRLANCKESFCFTVQGNMHCNLLCRRGSVHRPIWRIPLIKVIIYLDHFKSCFSDYLLQCNFRKSLIDCLEYFHDLIWKLEGSLLYLRINPVLLTGELTRIISLVHVNAVFLLVADVINASFPWLTFVTQGDSSGTEIVKGNSLAQRICKVYQYDYSSSLETRRSQR